MASRPARRAPRPLDQERLEDLAVRYVARFATTRSKLERYLTRKVRERGWSGDGEPSVEALAQRFADQGYVDDAAFALAKAGSLSSRGLGKRRLAQTLHAAGVAQDDRATAYARADRDQVDSALRLARRRRIGPFAELAETDPRKKDKAIAAMVRAGHSYALAKVIVAMNPESAVDEDELRSHFPYPGE